MRLEPRADCLDIAVRGPVLCAEFLRLEPAMEVRGRWVELAVHELLQRGLLLPAAFQHQNNALHWQSGTHWTSVEFRARQRVRVPAELHQFALIHPRGHARWNLRQAHVSGIED